MTFDKLWCIIIYVFLKLRFSLDIALVGTTPTYEVRNITRATSRFVIVGVGLFRSGFYFVKENKNERNGIH